MKKKNIKSKICNIVIFFAIILIITSLIYIGYIAIQWKKNDDISNLINDAEISNTSNNVNERIQKIENLKQINNDIVGWVEIEGTNISYPVLQTTNNEYYLNHDYKKEYDVNGSIFMDSNSIIGENSYNYMIYGHNNKNGIMFENLQKFKKHDFYSQHKFIRFTTAFSDDKYEIIAVVMSDAKSSDGNEFKYYSYNNIDNESDFNFFVENCKKQSIYEIEKTANFGEQLITLSTCEYSTEDGRLGIIAVKI